MDNSGRDSVEIGSLPRRLAGRFLLGPRLGAGAQSLVHAAHDDRTGRELALKLTRLPSDLTVDDRVHWLTQLQRQVNIAHQVRHADILELVDAGLDEHYLWMATERVHGRDLSHYTVRQRLLPEALVLHVGARLASALAHAHERGVLHRDLKPANVLLDVAAGAVKLADFGVARAIGLHPTQTGGLVGTPAYMAPETLAGSPASPVSDVYALGVMLFELLTGQRPHSADSLGALLKAQADDPPRRLNQLRPDLPEPVADSIDALIQRNPELRPSSPIALRDWGTHCAVLANVVARASRAVAEQPG